MHGLALDTSTYGAGYFAFVTGQFAYFLLLVVFTPKYKQSEVTLPKEQNGTECCAIPPAQGAGKMQKKRVKKLVPSTATLGPN